MIVVFDEGIAERPVSELSEEVARLFKKAKLTTSGTSVHAIVEPKK
jgi:hypothetical protein